MTLLYPIVLETEESGAVSAYVPGLPVYAAADSHAKAERAIRAVLAEYLNAHPASRPDARVRVARVSDRGKTRIRIVGVAALVGAKRSDAKARASRANGRLGGRPPITRPHERLGRRHHADGLARRRFSSTITRRTAVSRLAATTRRAGSNSRNLGSPPFALTQSTTLQPGNHSNPKQISNRAADSSGCSPH
jgi:hypothetical protein